MDKQKQIVEMFDRIASRYDLANRILSFGMDVGWRKEGCELALKRLGRRENLKILDVACGTGDMILHWQDRLNSCEFIGVDPSEGMLKVAQSKVGDCRFLQAQAQNLPLDDESVDVISIAYGLRNVCDYPLALREFYRVLKRGGVLLILEFMHNPNPSFLDSMGLFYTQKILPILGGLISKNKQAYTYLPNSIEEFASLETLKEDLVKSAFVDVWAKNYYAKISSLILASKEK
ncbi:bifunctional demethylmenaquinone methyltransferase/2-methoxy-6-polyprenyl-1,4-benzoquinol methylase UbiE [Helicobacter pametensis]|uniref:bifunctional demethylmenaquinone methyltransferase/2-methoxy-6-polyprenyl-1,4-benzoquinol methylase UbiE n=1 Tax=Helicobacter pametensis TaxID=95149 RepID=UPI000481ABD9|nr:bifunctional demethylmenaquinone methyltransferase/2-methoxy-6-polyprenyl-1,4-benzoquinol methylase UbiE [Helicobacter pametensis]